jgi:hypothetical protein
VISLGSAVPLGLGLGLGELDALAVPVAVGEGATVGVAVAVGEDVGFSVGLADGFGVDGAAEGCELMPSISPPLQPESATAMRKAPNFFKGGSVSVPL